MNRFFLLLAALITAASARAQDIAQYIESQPSLKGAAVGVCVVKDGEPILSYNAQTRLTPASNLKLVTTGAALHAFGPGYRFKTGIGYRGTIENGTLHGDVIIRGGGDPTIGASDSTAYKADALFWKWKELLTKAGIKRIDGNIIGDGSAYEGGLGHIGWEAGDAWTYYGAGTSALCFYENAIDFNVSAGAQVGAPANITQKYPQTPWLQVENQGVTGPAGSGNSLLMNTSELSDKAVFTGSYAIDRRPKVERAANKFGARTCAYQFYQNLKATGWEVTGSYGDEIPDQCGDDGVIIIGETESPELRNIARKTNYDSDNFYAEALLRAMGEAASGNAVYDSCLVAIGLVLEDIVQGTGGLIQKDGSGLARGNAVSPEWMAQYLYAMQKSPAFPAFLQSIPRPGEGTLYNLKNLPQWKFRIKSGTMGGVLCYSGYILAADGSVSMSFAIMVNNFDAKLFQVRQALEGLMLLIGKN